MGDIDLGPRARRALLTLVGGAFASRLLPAQVAPPLPGEMHPPGPQPDTRLPNGKLQREEILKADYQKNVKDARGLIELATSFEEDLEKDDRFVLSVSSLKKLDEMEKIIRRMRDRLKKL
jgi:hypothetical protein